SGDSFWRITPDECSHYQDTKPAMHKGNCGFHKPLGRCWRNDVPRHYRGKFAASRQHDRRRLQMFCRFLGPMRISTCRFAKPQAEKKTRLASQPWHIDLDFER